MKLFLCLAAITAAIACESPPRTPTAPGALSSPAIPFAGVWTGEYRITRTTQSLPFRVGTVMPFTLRLEQAGAVLRGNFQTNTVLIDVTGAIDENGVMSLQGSAPGLGPVDYVGAATLTRFRARVDATTGLAGDLEYRLDRTVESRLGPSTVHAAEIISAQRTKLPPSTFDGTWAGSFVVRECTGTCLPPHVSEIGFFQLDLQQTGNSVTGVIWVVRPTQFEVSGRVEGNRLILDSRPADGRSRILDWSTERDRYGRMVGSFAYEEFGIRRRVQLGAVSQMPYPFVGLP